MTAIDGTIFVKFALMLPLLLVISLGAMDYAWTLTHKSVLQDAADRAALAGAKELSLSDAQRENVAAVVGEMVTRYIDSNSDSLTKKKAAAPVVKASITDDPLQVEVSISQSVDALVGGTFGLEFPALQIRSVARVVGQPNICVLVLDPLEGAALSLERDARMTGRNCAVYSNSSDSGGLFAKDNAKLTATFICSHGGMKGTTTNFSPLPITDCPSFEDPLSGRAEPISGPCLETGLVVKGGSRTLTPGTYCGGVKVTDGAKVRLEPGVYIFQDGPFMVDKMAVVEGEGVGLFFTGYKAVLWFTNDSEIRLSAPTTGEMAGLLVFGSRNQSTEYRHNLLSNNAPLLLGTIYIPSAELRVDASAPIAQDSAYTAIVTRALRLYGGPHLILNTNYDKTDVPVPKGIRGAGQPVSLVE